jgi:hypothetical protein
MTRMSWLTSLAVGAAAGAAGTALMDVYWSAIKKLSEPKERGQSGQSSEPTTAKVAGAALRKIGVEQPSRKARQIGGNVVHWTYGTSWGAIAGIAERAGLPVAAFAGQPFGAALWGGGDLWMLYKLGFAKHPRDYPAKIHAQSLGAHLVYGLGVCTVLSGAELVARKVGERREARWLKTA